MTVDAAGSERTHWLRGVTSTQRLLMLPYFKYMYSIASPSHSDLESNGIEYNGSGPKVVRTSSESDPKPKPLAGISARF